jgi:predicted O-methyltransferase YrrM
MHMQEILSEELACFGPHSLHILETGTLRSDNEPGRIGDGWSTIWFAERARDRGGVFRSVDLDVKAARAALSRRALQDYVQLMEGHSIECLGRLLKESTYLDVILLDSENDGQLIFHEFLLARQLLREGGLLLIDDVQIPGTPLTGALKGSVVLPFLMERRIRYRLRERRGWNGYRTGVLTVDVKDL